MGIEASVGSGSSSYLLSYPVFQNVRLAISLCQLYGGYMAEIESEAEYIFVTDFIKPLVANESVVVSGSDEGHEGVWGFTNPGNGLYYLTWAPGQPDGGANENCLFLSPGKNRPLFSDGPCVGPDFFRFLCEVGPTN